MKIRRMALRLWIAGTSIFSFLVGLAMLAHAPKPVPPKPGTTQYQAVVVEPMATLAPLAPLDFTGYFQDTGPAVSQFTVQERPTPVPQVFVPQQPPVAVPQPQSASAKNGKGGAQAQGGGQQQAHASTGGS